MRGRMDYFFHHPWPFSYARVAPMETSSPSTEFCQFPSPNCNWQPPFSFSTVHLPSFASPSSSPSASQHVRYVHSHHHRLSNSSTAANRTEHTAYPVHATASSNYTSFPCSPDSASLTPLGLLTVPSPLCKLASSSLKSDFALRPFQPEAVAALLRLPQQFEFSTRSTPTALGSRNTAFRGKSEAHVRPVLLLDVRTFARQTESRIRSAVNISIPHAILKRSSFTIDKIRDTLSTKRARSLLRDWSSYANIIIYDANSVTIHDTGIISYITRKFRQENCTAELGWLYGGFDNFSRNYTELCEPNSPPDPNSSKLLLSSCLSNASCENRSSQSSPPAIADENGKEQPSQNAEPHRHNAIHLDVVTGALTSPTSSNFGSKGGVDTSKHSSLEMANAPAKSLANAAHGLPFSSTGSPSVGETVAIRLPPCITEDEAGSEEGCARNSTCLSNQSNRLDSTSAPCSRSENGGRYLQQPKSAPKDTEFPVSDHRNQIEEEMNVHHVPQFLKELAIGKEAEQKLAKIFQTIDKTEQRRLQSLMLHHARYPTTDHPFSISAGVERGEKNRYVNIWPYDYTRVHLGLKTPPAGGVQNDSDYINASLIKAPHCEQTYVATQGPLPATFNDFWNVVWIKDIKVIVMLTREEECGRLKCHRYWPDEKDVPIKYGPAVTVELLNKDTLPEGDGSIIRRHLRMRYIPTGATRIIMQLQYIGWPDFGVPDTPLAVLQLRAAVLAGPRIHEKSSETNSQSSQNRASTILVHCSAGCGRTGAFCTIDSTLRLLERLDGPFGCSSEAAIADDIVLAKHEAEIEARNRAQAEQEEAELPHSLSAFSTGNFSVATALKTEPTPDTFCLKMPKILKGNRRGAAVGQSEGTQPANNNLEDKSNGTTDVHAPGTPLRNRNVFSSTTTCSTSENKLTSQPANKNSHPPFTTSVVHKMGPPAQFKPLPYPNLRPSAESRCTRDVVRGCVEVFREQRLSMVQTLRQFVFCYEAVLWQLLGMVNPVCKAKFENMDNEACFVHPAEETRRPKSPTGGNPMAKSVEVGHTASTSLAETQSADSRVESLQLKKIRKRKRDEQPSEDFRDKQTYSFNSSSSCSSPSIGRLGVSNLVNEAPSVSPSLSYTPSVCLTNQSPLSQNRSFISTPELGDLQPAADTLPRSNGLQSCIELPKTSVKLGSEGNKSLAQCR